MPEQNSADNTSDEGLPIGADVLELDLAILSTDLAERLSEVGASDKAIDAAGGKGTADRLRAAHHQRAAAPVA